MKSILAYIVFVVLIFISCNSTNKKEKSVSILNEPNSSAQPKTKIEEKQNSINSTPLEKSNPKPSKPFKFKSSKSIFITDKYYNMFLVIDYSCHQNVKAQIEATNNLLLETLKAY